MDLVIILVKVDTTIIAVTTILMTVQDSAGLILLTLVTLSHRTVLGVNPITQMTVKSLVIGAGRKVISDLTVLTMDHEYLQPKL